MIIRCTFLVVPFAHFGMLGFDGAGWLRDCSYTPPLPDALVLQGFRRPLHALATRTESYRVWKGLS